MRLIGTPFALALFVLAASCGGDGPAEQTGGPGGGGGGGGGGGNTCASTSTAIVIGDNFFNPDCTTVGPGATVTWTWTGGVAHNVIFADASIGNAGDRTSGTIQRQFPTAGTFTYQCSLHAGMNGSIVVQ